MPKGKSMDAFFLSFRGVVGGGGMRFLIGGYVGIILEKCRESP